MSPDGSIVDSHDSRGGKGYGALHRYETETSGGKANAIEIFPFAGPTEWIVLTDDEQGWVSVLEWDRHSSQLLKTAQVRLGVQEGAEEEERDTGASHAVWLS